MKNFHLSKKVLLFFICTILICVAITGTGIALAYTEYDSPYVHETRTFKKNFIDNFTTNTGESTFNYDTAIVTSATNKAISKQPSSTLCETRISTANSKSI